MFVGRTRETDGESKEKDRDTDTLFVFPICRGSETEVSEIHIDTQREDMCASVCDCASRRLKID